jgi:hypothetical protein
VIRPEWETVDEREASYWVMVFVGGPVAGLVAGILWTVWMVLLVGPNLAHWLFAGGLFAATMTVPFTVMIAIVLRLVRREWRVSGDERARKRVLDEAARLKYAPVVQDANFLRFRPRGFKIKPTCSTIEVWFTPESVVMDGPYVAVSPLAKRLAKS